MKDSLYFLVLFLFIFLLAQSSSAFEKALAKVSTGIDSPHILKKDEYSLNTRNIKVLAAHGGQLWMGTAMGVIRYNTATVEDYEIFDNRNVLLSNGIFSIKHDRQGLPWIGTYGGACLGP